MMNGITRITNEQFLHECPASIFNEEFDLNLDSEDDEDEVFIGDVCFKEKCQSTVVNELCSTNPHPELTNDQWNHMKEQADLMVFLLWEAKQKNNCSSTPVAVTIQSSQDLMPSPQITSSPAMNTRSKRKMQLISKSPYKVSPLQDITNRSVIKPSAGVLTPQSIQKLAASKLDTSTDLAIYDQLGLVNPMCLNFDDVEHSPKKSQCLNPYFNNQDNPLLTDEAFDILISSPDVKFRKSVRDSLGVNARMSLDAVMKSRIRTKTFKLDEGSSILPSPLRPTVSSSNPKESKNNKERSSEICEAKFKPPRKSILNVSFTIDKNSETLLGMATPPASNVENVESSHKTAEKPTLNESLTINKSECRDSLSEKPALNESFTINKSYVCDSSGGKPALNESFTINKSIVRMSLNGKSSFNESFTINDSSTRKSMIGKIPLNKSSTMNESINQDVVSEKPVLNESFTINDSSNRKSMIGKIPLNKSSTMNESVNQDVVNEKPVLNESFTINDLSNRKSMIGKIPLNESSMNEKPVLNESFTINDSSNRKSMIGNIPLNESSTMNESVNQQDVVNEKPVLNESFTINDSSNRKSMIGKIPLNESSTMNESVNQQDVVNEKPVLNESFTINDSSNRKSMIEKIPLNESSTMNESVNQQDVVNEKPVLNESFTINDSSNRKSMIGKIPLNESSTMNEKPVLNESFTLDKSYLNQSVNKQQSMNESFTINDSQSVQPQSTKPVLNESFTINKSHLEEAILEKSTMNESFTVEGLQTAEDSLLTKKTVLNESFTLERSTLNASFTVDASIDNSLLNESSIQVKETTLKKKSPLEKSNSLSSSLSRKSTIEEKSSEGLKKPLYSRKRPLASVNKTPTHQRAEPSSKTTVGSSSQLNKRQMPAIKSSIVPKPSMSHLQSSKSNFTLKKPNLNFNVSASTLQKDNHGMVKFEEKSVVPPKKSKSSLMVPNKLTRKSLKISAQKPLLKKQEPKVQSPVLGPKRKCLLSTPPLSRIGSGKRAESSFNGNTDAPKTRLVLPSKIQSNLPKADVGKLSQSRIPSKGPLKAFPTFGKAGEMKQPKGSNLPFAGRSKLRMPSPVKSRIPQVNFKSI